MGFYSEYLNHPLANNFDLLTQERKAQLRKISQLRGGRDVLVFAADLSKQLVGISITYSDLLPISDQLANLTGNKLDLILETPGGSAEVAEEIVRVLRSKYEEVAVIVPGWAKSAGTIMAMAADEILMGPISALGPIDAQIIWQGKQFSADALLEAMEKIKKEVTDTGVLNKAYIPMLQGISPGEIQSAENALNFAQVLAANWLAQYKFKNWMTHSSTGEPVSEEQKLARAKEVAHELADHRKWLTHARSIKIDDLEAMRVRITNYANDPALSEAITRYYTLLQMTFSGNIYKIIETAETQIMRVLGPIVPAPQPLQVPGGPGAQPPADAKQALVNVGCLSCHAAFKVQANLNEPQPLQPGCIAFPADSKLRCPNCGAEIDLTDTRRQIEAQTKKRVV